jgi:hypothetical protein
MSGKTVKSVQETHQPCRMYDHGFGHRSDPVLCNKTLGHLCSTKRPIRGNVLVNEYTYKTLVTNGQCIAVK